MLNLVEDGVLHLDAPLCEYLSELKRTPWAQYVRLQHLASHSSGYQGLNISDPQVAYFYSWDKYAEFARSARCMFPPGAVFNYDHTECVLLGEVIRRVTGVNAREWVQRIILEPLGLHPGNAGTDPTAAADHAIDAATGNYRRIRSVAYAQFWQDSLSDITLSPSDMATFASALVRGVGHTFDQRTVRRFVQQLIQLPCTIGGTHREQAPLSFGFGCAEYRGGLLGHNGSGRGQTCSLRFDPVRNATIVVAMNAWQPNLRDWLVNRLVYEFFPARPSPAESSPGTLPDPRDLVGSYMACVQEMGAEVTCSDTHLSCKVNNRSCGESLELMLVRDRRGQWSLEPDATHLALGFFRQPESVSYGMMLGLNAFKRLADASNRGER